MGDINNSIDNKINKTEWYKSLNERFGINFKISTKRCVKCEEILLETCGNDNKLYACQNQDCDRGFTKGK